MRFRKSFKIIAIGVGLLLAVLLLSLAIFVFNPFEGALPDMRFAVPRDVDFFVRKVDLADDFEDFPAPWFWSELKVSPDWAEIERGPAYKAINGDGSLTRVFEQVRDQTQLLRDQSSGFLDLMADVLGTEIEIAGKLPVGSGLASWCFYARVTWRAKFLHGLLGYSFVQEEFRKGGVQVSVDGDFYKLQMQGAAQPLFLARQLDCVLLGNDRDVVQRSWELASGVGDQDSFGGSANYQAGIRGRIREWEERTDVIANALEFYVKPNKAFELPSVTFDDNWPDSSHPTDMNSRVLASFLNLTGWLGLTGALIFEEGTISLLANIELNQNEHTTFQSRFFKTESQHRREWLDPFLAMVPATASAAAAMRMPPGDFLREMYSAMEEAEKSLLNDSLRKTGKYNSMLDLISEVEPAFYPRTGFVFRRNQFFSRPDPDIPIAVPSPSPEVAWVFWLRPGGENIVGNFVEQLTKYRNVLGLDQAYNLHLPVGGGRVGADAAREFTQPQLPATGSFATLVYPPFFVISNSGPFIKEMMGTLFELTPSIRSLDEFREYSAELPSAVNGFVFVNGSRIEEVMRDYQQDLSNITADVDPAWAMENRSSVQTAVFRSGYARNYASLAAIPESERPAFEAEVQEELRNRWRGQSSSYTAEATGAISEAMALCRLLSSAYMQITLEPRYLRLTMRAIAEFK